MQAVMSFLISGSPVGLGPSATDFGHWASGNATKAGPLIHILDDRSTSAFSPRETLSAGLIFEFKCHHCEIFVRAWMVEIRLVTKVWNLWLRLARYLKMDMLSDQRTSSAASSNLGMLVCFNGAILDLPPHARCYYSTPVWSMTRSHSQSHLCYKSGVTAVLTLPNPSGMTYLVTWKLLRWWSSASHFCHCADNAAGILSSQPHLVLQRSRINNWWEETKRVIDGANRG